jgi:hypothetical protein
VVQVGFEKALREELVKVIPNVFPLYAPEGTLPPYCVYVSSYGERDLAFEGYLSTKEIEVTVHVVGSTYADMKTYTTSVLDSLVAFQGKKIGTDLIKIQSVHYDKPTEMVDPEEYYAHSWVDFKFRI